MSKSLKSCIPRFAQLLGMSPASLYERVRALAREEILNPQAGKGPGSGVRATPESVALLLIAAMASDSLAEVGERTRELAGATARALSSNQTPPLNQWHQLRRAKCALTGETTFRRALRKLLINQKMRSRVLGIQVRRGTGVADIICIPKSRTMFVAEHASERRLPGMEVTAFLEGRFLEGFAQEISEDAGEEDGEG